MRDRGSGPKAARLRSSPAGVIDAHYRVDTLKGGGGLAPSDQHLVVGQDRLD